MNMQICIRLILFAVYIKATAILCVITLVTDSIATLLTGLGLKTIDANLKYKVSEGVLLILHKTVLF